MNYKKLLISSVLLIILSVIMFTVAVSLFAYKGEQLNSMVVKIGEFSFLFWLPVLILGVILFIVSIILILMKKPR